ncbi:MAG: hypothetical protein COA43_07835 [Robiginitomaculum sp.]|nr:MAG: hypothetical protein COA43_07835 [Robiginitomaculum sp.]
MTRFWRDQKGQFSVIFALFGIPLLLVCGYAVDLNRAVSKETNLSAALDAAALASVIPAHLTVPEREAYARTIFAENYFGDLPVSLSITASRERVAITGTTHVDTLLEGVVKNNSIRVRKTSEAVLTRSDVICVLALDPSGERAVEFVGQAVFNSPACSVQVNSINDLALVSDVVQPPIAHTFCVAGISRGEFFPYVKHKCSIVSDPYAGLTPPPAEPCLDVGKIKGVEKKKVGKPKKTDEEKYPEAKHAKHHKGVAEGTVFDHTHASHHNKKGATSVLTDVEDEVGDGVVLQAGTYCNGLDINGIDVVFTAGIYVIQGGRFRIRNGAEAVGNDVVFILMEEKTILLIEKNAQLTIKAPSKGTYAGIALYHAEEQTLRRKIKDKGKKKHLITSGGGLSITGTVYFPTSNLEITSESPVVSRAPATSFIVNRLTVSGRAHVEVHVDHEAGGIPPMLPRSDEGARLVR